VSHAICCSYGADNNINSDSNLRFEDAVVGADGLRLMHGAAVGDDVGGRADTGGHRVRHADRALASRRSFVRLRLPLVVRQHRRLDRLLVHVHVALPRTVVRPAVVDHVRHVMRHVVAPRPLLLGDVLALLHAEDLRQPVNGDL